MSFINNAVYNGYGEIIGYRCRQCGDVVLSMWGAICNGCRAINQLSGGGK